METPKKSLIYQETELSYLSGNRNPGSNFLSSKSEKNPLLKRFLYFGEIKLSGSKLKKLLLFQKGTYKAPKTNKKSAPKKFLVFHDVFAIFTAVKHKEIPCEANLDVWLS